MRKLKWHLGRIHLVTCKVRKAFFLIWPQCQLILGLASTWTYWLNQIFTEYECDYGESKALRSESVSTKTSLFIQKDCERWVYGILHSFSYVRLLWLDLLFRKYFTRIFPICGSIFFSVVWVAYVFVYNKTD